MIKNATRDAVRSLFRPSTRVTFSPLEFDPYLLFDAESSMLGNLENPTLDLDAYYPETLDVITATRAGVATYTDLHGTIKTASADTVRVDWSLGYPAMLIEPSATNLVEYSEDFSNSYWLKTDITISDAPVAAPDGTMTASHVAATGPDAHLSRSNIVTSGSDTVSIWARTVSGAGTCFFNYHGGTPATITEEWQRFEVTPNTNHVYPVNFRGSSTLTEIYIWGAQAETGSVATSYIPTSGGSVAERTRNADNLVIDGTNFSDFYNATEGTIYTEAVGRGYFNQNSNFAICLNNSSNDSIYQRSPSNTQTLVVINGGNVQAQMFSATSSTGTLVRRAASFKLNNFKASQDGVDITPDTAGTMPTVNKFYIGASALGDHQLNGHIKRLIYWPTHSDNL